MPTAFEPRPHEPESVDTQIESESQIDAGAPTRLTTLRAGDHGRLHTTRLVVEDREMLRALGLAEHSRFRVCKAGDPWILQVRGTRVGISDAVADRILVTREP